MPGLIVDKSIQDKQFRIHYYGCGLLDFDAVDNPRLLLSHPLINQVSTPGQVLVRTKGKLFYVNKHEGITQELSLGNLNIDNLKIDTLQDIKEIAEQSKFLHLYTRAKIVTDLEVLLTPEKRRQALLCLDDNNINFKNTAYTYAVQGFLARYMGESQHEEMALSREIEHESQIKKSWPRRIFASNKQAKLAKIKLMRAWAQHLHSLSAEFKRLEEFVNNAAGDPDFVIAHFKEQLNLAHTKILELIDAMPDSSDSTQKKLLIKLKNKLIQNHQNFIKSIDSLGDKPSKADLECLLSSADRALTIKSLGTYLREQLADILDTGIKGAYKISNNRLKDVLQVPRLVAYLSDAEHMLLIKGQSVVEGPKDNDTYSPIPRSMLDAITGVSTLDDNPKSAKWFSLAPYLNKWRPNYIDEALCLLTEQSRDDNNFHANYFYHFLWQPLKIIASVLEIAFAVPRLLLVASLGLIEAGLSVLPFPSKPNSAKVTWRINQFISDTYDKFAVILAPLTYMQRAKANHYRRDNPLDDHQEIIDECADYNTYCHKLFVYVTPQLIATYIQDFFGSLVVNFTNFIEDIKYLLAPASSNQVVYEKIKLRQESLELLTQDLAKHFEAKKPTFTSETASDLPTASYAKVKYCQENSIHSPLDVFYEIAVVLSSDVVNPMFRKSPGIATFYFMLSMLTFGTFVLPTATFAWMKPLPGWLQYIANQISLHFTGKPTSAGLMEQMIACFLGWKLGFFSTEFVAEMLEGHYEILEKLFEEPEKIVLGLVGLVGIGMALQFVPELPTTLDVPGIGKVPNLYLIIINTFTEEAKACAEGTIGLTSIEYGFLGLKFAMLFHSMLAGSEHAESDKNEIKDFVYALEQKQILPKLVTLSKSEDWINNLPNKEYICGKLQEIKVKHKLSVSDTILADIASGLSMKTLDINSFVKSEAYQKTDASLKQQAKPTQAKQQPNFKEAKQALQEAVKLSMSDKRLMFTPSAFGVNKEALQFYDNLDRLFNEYNAAVQREHQDNARQLLIDKRPFLDVFYNKYIYRRSNNFVRSLLLIFYPIPLISRGLKYLWATLTNKPSMQHQVVKNFCKDLVIISQIFTPVARMVADFNMYVSGVLRGVAFLIVTPTSAILYPFVQLGNYLLGREITPFKDWFAIIDENICKYIALHKTPALQPIRQLIVRAARVAGTNSDLQSAAKKIDKQLEDCETRSSVAQISAKLGIKRSLSLNDISEHSTYDSGPRSSAIFATTNRCYSDDSLEVISGPSIGFRLRGNEN